MAFLFGFSKVIRIKFTVLVQRILRISNVQIVRLDKIRRLGEDSHEFYLWKNWIMCKEINSELLLYILRNTYKSKSQLQQDLMALWISTKVNDAKPGVFVEFGATNGKSISNSYLLENEFHWQGLVAEPAKRWHQELARNRSCSIDFSCVFNESGRYIEFAETDETEYSTISLFLDADSHAAERVKHKTYLVETITLEDLLEKHNIPTHINYMSVDTEGSEYEILKNFPFSKYKFDFISIEHNYNPYRESIYTLLNNASYVRVFPQVSQFEDWYVSPLIARMITSV